MRYPDWPIRINKYIIAVRDKKFRYGRHDCTTFAAGAVKAITGVDPMAEFRGKYTSKQSARAALKQIGQSNLYRTLVKKFGGSVPGARGKKGDIAYHDQSCGIVIGSTAIFIGENGYLLIPISKLQRVFRVD